jgi:hypothetical protein
MVERPELVACIVRPGPLDDEERIRVSAYLFATLRNGEFTWGQYREGPTRIGYCDEDRYTCMG